MSEAGSRMSEAGSRMSDVGSRMSDAGSHVRPEKHCDINVIEIFVFLVIYVK